MDANESNPPPLRGAAETADFFFKPVAPLFRCDAPWCRTGFQWAARPPVRSPIRNESSRSLKASTARTWRPGASNCVMSYSVTVRQSLPRPISWPSKKSVNPLSTVMRSVACATAPRAEFRMFSKTGRSACPNCWSPKSTGQMICRFQQPVPGCGGRRIRERRLGGEINFHRKHQSQDRRPGPMEPTPAQETKFLPHNCR